MLLCIGFGVGIEPVHTIFDAWFAVCRFQGLDLMDMATRRFLYFDSDTDFEEGDTCRCCNNPQNRIMFF
jgi:hypothetical protein